MEYASDLVVERQRIREASNNNISRVDNRISDLNEITEVTVDRIFNTAETSEQRTEHFAGIFHYSWHIFNYKGVL